MSYEVLARKWRPQVFAEVVGQEHVTTTLANALAQGRVGHAYLFSGIRGVGKTTTARILAKAVNCVKGPTATPCGVCTSCIEIARGMSMDCLEIDGASNRGVDEIRSLREKIGYAPVGGKRKVYIIDEVHMLTTEAFNALLKTLEEPPAHALFILATTHARKVPPTILSRCQRFHFRRIPTAAIEKHLGMMVKKEGMKIEPDALALVARRGDGSLRDAESLLEQVSSLGGKGSVTAAAVREFLGLLEDDQVFAAGRALVAGEGETVLSLLEELVRSGGDPVEFAEALIAHFRNLLVAGVAPNSPALAELSSEEARRYTDEAARMRGVEVLPYLDTIGVALPELRKSPQPRLELEVLLLGLAGRRGKTPAREANAGGGGAAGGATGGRSGASGGGTPREPLAKGPGAKPGPSKPAPRPATRASDASAGDEAAGDEAARATDEPLGIDAVRDIWDAFVDEVNRKRRALGAYVAAASPSRVENGRLVLGFPDSQKWSMSQVEQRENRLFLAALLGNLLGREITLACDRVEGPSPADKDAGLRQFLDAFEGRILEARAPEPGRDLSGGTT